MCANRQLTVRNTRRVIYAQTAEPTRQYSKNEDTLSKLADRFVLEKRPVSGRHEAEKK